MPRSLLLLLLAAPAVAQLPPGKDGYTYPPGGTAGRTHSVVLAGTDWTPDVQFVVHHPRVKLEQLAPPGPILVPDPPYWFGQRSFLNDPNLPREVPARLHLPADLPPGPVRWSVVNANGAASGGVFVVGTGSEVNEDEARKGPQELPSLPVTLNGRLGRIEEEDRYRFTADAAGLVTVELFARRLGNDLNGVVEVFDGAKRIAEAIDTEDADPVLTFAAEKGKTYTLAVRDVDHRGYRNFTYRLSLTTGPRVVAAIPPAGRPGDRRPVEFVGYGIATGAAKLESVVAEVEFPRPSTGDTFTHRLHTPFGTAPPFTLRLSDTAERTEADGPKLPGPCGVSGRFTRRGERKAFTFAGRKGEVWEVAVQARGISSPLDPTLAVIGPDGKPLAANDDAGGSDPKLVVTLPAAGEYRVEVGDVSGKTPGPDAVYRLLVRRPASRFTLRVPAVVNVPVGGKVPLTVELTREGSFAGPVVLSLSGLPEGVTPPKELTLPPGVASLPVQLECAKTAGVSFARVTVTGTATVDDRAVTVTAVPKDDAPATLVATTLKPPFKVRSPEADGTRKAPRGATHLADLIVERTDGFAGEILLDMAGAQQRHRQGIRGPVFPVAPGVGKVLYPVTVPEWLETTRTSRIGLAAMAKIPDAKGTPRWVLAAMDGQVTMSIEGALMKLSRPPDELSVSAGGTAAVPLKLARSPHLTGKVTVELRVPPELKDLVSAAPLDWPADKPSATLTVTAKDDPKVAGVWKLTARATAARDGFPVVSECEVEVEFTRPPSGR